MLAEVGRGNTHDSLKLLAEGKGIGEAPGTRALWWALSRNGQASPKIWMGAYLASLAITRDLELVTFDQGFHGESISLQTTSLAIVPEPTGYSLLIGLISFKAIASSRGRWTEKVEPGWR